MICSDRIRTSISPSPPTPVVRSLPFLVLLAFTTLRVGAQPGWTDRTVFSSQDSLRAPSVVIAPDGEVYLVYSSSDDVHHWLTQPDRGSLSYAIRRESPPGPPVSREINLLAVDSAGKLHFASVFGESVPCLQYGTTATTGANTVFDRLKQIGDGICGTTIVGASIGLDRSGLLHMVFQRNNSLFYTVRGTDGIWTDPSALPSIPPISRSPTLLVTPSGEVHVTFSGVAGGTSTVYHYHVGGGSPNPLAQRSGSAEGVAPIVRTPDGRLHVAFSDEVDGSPAIRLITRDLLNQWGPPEIVMQGGVSPVGDLSLVADRYGALHVASALIREGGTGGTIVHLDNADGVWSGPTPITGSDVDHVATNRGNGFLVIRDSLLLLPSTLPRSHTDLSSVHLARNLLDFSPELAAVTRVLDLGTVTRSGVDTTIVITNLGRRLYERLLPDPTDTIRTDHFRISPLFSGLPEPVRGGDSLHVPVRLSFTQQGQFEHVLRITSNGGTDSILIRGAYYEAVAPERVLRLDTAVVEVGELQSLSGRISPPLAATDGVTTLRLTISIDPDALFPHTLSPTTADVETRWTYDGEGMITVDVEGRQGGYVIGEELFEVEFEGLLTAMPENEVVIDLLPGNILGDVITRPGLMFVEGCETGRLPPFGKGGFVGALRPNPAGTDVTFSWTAPIGVPASIRIYDANGAVVDERTLTVGTGQVLQTDVDLASLPSGLYFLELRTGAARMWSRFIRE